MIKSRSSDDYLHGDVILSKITEYDIFVYYCPNFKQLGVPFCSELRKDRKPTATIKLWNGKLLYKDFGCVGHAFNCFRYVMHKYSCTFLESLIIIDTDFRLNLNSIKNSEGMLTRPKATRQIQPNLVQIQTQIQKKRRQFSDDDRKFWVKYHITKRILITFGVEPISHYWVNKNRFSCKSITYAYKFGSRLKIYAPLEKDFKWTSNIKSSDIQGYRQLPKTGNMVILTSSLKDVMCLYAAGYSSVALQSEMQLPDEKLIQELHTRFKEVYVLYDNDYDNENNPGQTMAKEICEKFNLCNICIPDEYESKDPSDLVANIGSLNILKQIINDNRRSVKIPTG
jgi:5S rRNA maturation endonuclease (ribonuclease M5)